MYPHELLITKHPVTSEPYWPRVEGWENAYIFSCGGMAEIFAELGDEVLYTDIMYVDKVDRHHVRVHNDYFDQVLVDAELSTAIEQIMIQHYIETLRGAGLL